MPRFSTVMRPILLALPALCIALAVPVKAQLSATSPFLPAGTSAVGGPNGGMAGGAIELRGEMSTPQGMQFCIYDTTKKLSTWVGLNEKGNEFVVKSQDPAHDAISVVYQGRTMNLELRTAKVASSGIASAPTLNASALNPGAPPPADDAQKIQAIAAEVARRRMLREQELQKTTQPGSPPPAPVSVQPRQRRGQQQ